jgi:hypothetical protein
MSTHKMPTASELAGIAAALGREAVRNPAKAAQDALRLWLAAAAELDAKEAELEADAERRRQQTANPDDECIYMVKGEGSAQTYPAMKWINDNAGGPRDQFKTFRAFKAAWLAYTRDENSFYFSWRIYELKRFLTWRQEQRQKADSERKQARRRLERATAKIPSNKSLKMFAGHTPKSKHKKQ